MATIFCCGNIQPYRPVRVGHELKFTSFLEWAHFPRSTRVCDLTYESSRLQSPPDNDWQYAIQLVQQVNFGALESKRYFVPRATQDSSARFQEITERDLIEANFAKVNSYKNFKCTAHIGFFELNLYQKDPVNKHHRRANIARPSADIDLDTNKGGQGSANNNASEKVQVGQLPAGQASGTKTTGAKSETSTEALVASVTTAIGSSRFAIDGIGQGIYGSSDRTPRYVEEKRFSDDFIDDLDDFDGGYGSDNSHKDFTACSSEECGYCGHCDY